MTREEAIKRIQEHMAIHRLKEQRAFYITEALDMAIKALEQEPILDKIRAEIEQLPKTYPFVNHIDTYVKEDDVKKIIDKYKTRKRR